MRKRYKYFLTTFLMPLSLGILLTGCSRQILAGEEHNRYNRRSIYEKKADYNNQNFSDISVSSPNFSPDGSTIVFSGRANSSKSIYSYRISENKLYKITQPFGRFDGDPIFSPDGKKNLVFKWQYQRFVP